MPSAEDPKRLLLAGAEILSRVLEPRGFRFALDEHGKGSGGWFAEGSYRKGGHRLELHFRYSLGLVAYHIGGDALDHESYMRLLGVYGRNRYPDFPQRPLESFEHLAFDLQNYCTDFLDGDGEKFRFLARKFQLNPDMFKGVP